MVTSGEGATACLPLNILQCTGQPSTIKSFPVQSVSSAEFEKPCRALNEQRSHSGNLSMHEFSNWQPWSCICISLVCKAILLGSDWLEPSRSCSYKKGSETGINSL